MEKNYHALVDGRIYIGGAEDVPSVLENEKIDMVIDLRGETKVLHEKAIHLPIIEGIEGQNESVYRAIDQVVSAYHEGQNIHFHFETPTAKAASPSPYSARVGFLSDLPFAIHFCFEQSSRLGYLIAPPYPVHLADRATLLLP